VRIAGIDAQAHWSGKPSVAEPPPVE
jgi:hypothetical protein